MRGVGEGDVCRHGVREEGGERQRPTQPMLTTLPAIAHHHACSPHAVVGPQGAVAVEVDLKVAEERGADERGHDRVDVIAIETIHGGVVTAAGAPDGAAETASVHARWEGLCCVSVRPEEGALVHVHDGILTRDAAPLIRQNTPCGKGRGRQVLYGDIKTCLAASRGTSAQAQRIRKQHVAKETRGRSGRSQKSRSKARRDAECAALCCRRPRSAWTRPEPVASGPTMR